MTSALVLNVAFGAIVGGFAQGLSGFAFGLVSMSIWAWTIEPRLAAPMAIFGAFTGQLIAALTVRRGFDWAMLLPFLVGGLLGIPVGTALLHVLDIDIFKACLGAFLVIWCPIILFARHLPPIGGGGRLADGLVGMIGGVMGGVGGFSGPVPTLWCTLRRMDKDRQRSIIQNFNLVTLGFSLVASVIGGAVTRDMLPAFGIVAVAMLVPVLLGGKLYVGISEAAFRRIVLALLTCSGIALLASSVPKLLARPGSPPAAATPAATPALSEGAAR